MILKHYGLHEQPFGATPDPQFLFASRVHREALASLLYAVESGRGFTALIAPPGLGKTTLLFHLLGTLRGKAKTAFVFQTQCKPRELLRFLLKEFGVTDPTTDFVAMHHALNDMLAAEAIAGRKCVIVLDEAHNLSDSVLESVRLLSDFETPSRKLLHIVIAGQSELRERLSQPSLDQLRQRIGVVCKLAPLQPREIDEYIQHRLKAAGYSGAPLFTPAAMAVIRAFSRGIPRNINALCFSAMSLGFALGRKELDAQILEEAATDLSLEELDSPTGYEEMQSEGLSDQQIRTAEPPEPPPAKPPDSTPLQPDIPQSGGEKDEVIGLSAATGAVDAPAQSAAELAAEKHNSPKDPPAPAPATAGPPSPPSPTHHGDPDPLRNIDLSTYSLLDGIPPQGRPVTAARAAKESPWEIAIRPRIVTAEPELDALKQRFANHTQTARVATKGPNRDYVVVGLIAAVFGAAILALLLWSHPNIGLAMGKSVDQTPASTNTVPGKAVTAPDPSQVAKRHVAVESRIPVTTAAMIKAPASRGEHAFTSAEEIPPPQLKFDDRQQSQRLQELVLTPVGSRSGQWKLARRADDDFVNTPITMVPPVYPEAAKQTGLEGTVVLQIQVDKNGRVQRLERVGGDPQLADAAISAVRQWRYPAYIVDGKPKESNKQVEMRFSLGTTSTGATQ